MNRTTERLLLRPFAPEDGEALYQYLSDPGTVYFEPYGPCDRETAWLEAEARSRNPAFVAVCLRTGELIGNLYIAPESEGVWELGYVFHPAYRGRGYATEAAQAAVGEAFSRLGASRVVGHCALENEPSWRLMERLGMRRKAVTPKGVSFKRDDAGEPIWWDDCDYALSKEEWLAMGQRGNAD